MLRRNSQPSFKSVSHNLFLPTEHATLTTVSEGTPQNFALQEEGTKNKWSQEMQILYVNP
jgi:hypothetical protein